MCFSRRCLHFWRPRRDGGSESDAPTELQFLASDLPLASTQVIPNLTIPPQTTTSPTAGPTRLSFLRRLWNHLRKQNRGAASPQTLSVPHSTPMSTVQNPIAEEPTPGIQPVVAPLRNTTSALQLDPHSPPVQPMLGGHTPGLVVPVNTATACNKRLELALAEPLELSVGQLKRIDDGKISLTELSDKLSDSTSKIEKLTETHCRIRRIEIGSSSNLTSSLPLYAAKHHFHGLRYNAYYEVFALPEWCKTGKIVLGFTADLDTHNLPGFYCGSVAAHIEEGAPIRVYVDNVLLKIQDNSVFRVGETVGVGITLSYLDEQLSLPSPGGNSVAKVEFLYTRTGPRLPKNIVEVFDLSAISASNKMFPGLDGRYDLFAAVAAVEKVEFEVDFDRKVFEFNAEGRLF